MVFQSYALYPHMTVGENMGFSLRLANVPKAEREAEIARVGELLGLGDYLDRYPRHLSGGQRQRVAMGRAIVRDPKVFLFDEPLSNLDAKLRAQMRAEIKAMHRRLGTTTIYVTHDQTEAMTMADVIVVLRAGRIEQIGAPLDLYRAPANAFVAGFIGTPAMNLLAGRIGDGEIVLDGGARIAVPAPLAVPTGQAIRLGIRPKHIATPEDGHESLDLVIEDVEPTGEEVEIRGLLSGQPLTAVLPASDARPGDRLRIAVPTECAFVFDAATGSRLWPEAAAA